LKKPNQSKKKSTRKAARKNDNTNAKHWAKEWFDALIWAAVAAIILRTFFFGAYRIPTPSMEKTLMTGDFLIVTKLAYGA
jgi:signal peptidase I